MARPEPVRSTPFFVAGGTLPVDAPSYISRQADEDLYQALRRSEYCYVLTSRQMGKSSLMVRTALRLRQHDTRIAVLDLTAVGQNLTPEQWYAGLLGRMGRGLDLEEELESYWLAHQQLGPLQRWTGAIEEVVLSHVTDDIVVFIDEIDVVRTLPFPTDEFFAAIRECHTRRALQPDLRRLTFCLLGVATPSDLISDVRMTPFNIGTRIDLVDFSAEESRHFTRGLDRDGSDGMVSRAYHWTHGHPYLMQRLCAEAAAKPSVTSDSDVDSLCHDLFFSHRAQERDDNLLFVRDQLMRRMRDPGPLLSLYGQARRGESVPDDERDPLTGVLRLSGVTRVEDGALRVRNRIYERVFDSGWVARHMPDAELERQRAANRRLRTLLARSQVDKGRMMLRENDTNGLLYMAQARETADGMGKFADDIAEEWALWHWQLDGRLMQVFGHDDEVTAMGFSPDGRLFVTGSADGNAQLWDTGTGERQGKPLAHGSRVGRDPRWVRVSPTSSLVCFSPDGRLVAVGGEDGRISVWNAETADLHLRLELPDPHTLDQMTITPDGNLVAYAALGRRSVWRWDLRDGSVLVDGALLPHDAEGTGILTRDGSNMLVFDNDIGLAVIDAATAQVQWQTDRFGPLTSAVWSDSFIAAGTFVGNVVVVYDWQGRPVHEFSTDVFSDTAELGSDPAHVEITPDGRSFLSVTHRGLKLWDLATGEARGEPILHEGWIVYRSFSADSRLIAGAFGSTVLVWDVETGEQIIEPIRLPNPVKGLMFHPTDPRTLAVQSVDRSVRLWNVGPAPLYSTLATYPGPPEATNFSNGMVAFSTADPLVAACSARHPEVVVYNVETGETHCGPLVHTVAPNPAPAPWPPMPNALAFSPDGRRLAVANGTHGVYLWDIHAAALAMPVQECRPASLAFSPDGWTLAWLRWRDPGDALRLWDMGRGEPMTFSFEEFGLGYVGDPGGVDFNTAGDRLLLVTHQGRVMLLSTRDMTQVGRTLRLNGRSDCARWSPDDSLIVTASEDTTAQLWDASTQRPVGPPMSHAQRVRWANFSPDGRYVATASEDMTAQLWDVASGKRVALPMRHSSAVLCIEFSPDGRYVATAAAQDARLWELPRTPDTLAEVQRKTWLATGTRLTDDDAVESLGWQEWQALRLGTGSH